MLARSAALGLAALGITLAQAPQARADVTLNFSSWIPWSHPVNREIYIPWMEAVTEASEGRIRFRQLPKAVAAPPAHLDAVRTGQADLAMAIHGFDPVGMAAYQFAELPLMEDSTTNMSIALQRTHDEFLADQGYYVGAHVIGVNTNGPGAIHHKTKNILSPADMEGQKMRTGGPVPKAIVEAWGGVPISAPASKSYEILSTGVADGITFIFESLPSFNLTEITPYSTKIEGGMFSATFYFVMNQDAYDALSDEDRAVIDAFSGEVYAKMAGEGWDRLNEAGEQAVRDAGNSVKDAPPEMIEAIAALKEKFLADYLETAESKGLDGQAIYDFFNAELAKLDASN